jgi:hypothetical protein
MVSSNTLASIFDKVCVAEFLTYRSLCPARIYVYLFRHSCRCIVPPVHTPLEVEY